MENDFLHGLQIGATIVGQRLDRDARIEELKAQAALRRIQERAATQQMGFALQAHNMMIDERAEMTKAMAKVQLESQPFLPAPPGTEDMGQMIGPDGSPMGQPGMVPNPAYTPLDVSLMKNVLPVVGKFRPQEVDNFVSNVSMLPYRLAEAKRQEALAIKDTAAAQAPPKPLSSIGKMQADRALALQNGDTQAADEIDAAIAKLHSTVASDVQKMVDEHKKQTGKDDEVDKLYRIKMGLDAKAAVVQPVTFEQFANKHLAEFLDSPRHFDPKLKKMRRPKDIAEATADMKLAYDSMQDHIKGMPVLEPGVTGQMMDTNVTLRPNPSSRNEEKVTVVDAQGNRFKLPAWQLDQAIKEGFKKVEP